jgi:ABC-type spermidine/putrescine transport system permease subunit II
MRIETFAGLLELLQAPVDRMRLRSFGKQHRQMCDKPLRLLELYKKELYGERPTKWEAHTARFRYRVSLITYALSFFFGLLAALGLLHYNGDAPVNVVYFFFVAVVLPVAAMLLSLIALIKVSSSRNAWLHMTLTYIVELFTRRHDEILRRIGELEPRVYNWTAALTA